MPYIDVLTLVTGAAGAAAGIILTPLVTTTALGMAGFSAVGPVAGTTAARMQATGRTRNPVAGLLFATAQSVAMGGPVPMVIIAIGAGVGGVGGAIFGATSVGASVASMSMDAASAVGAGIGTAAASVVGMGAAAVAAAAAAAL